MRPILFALSLSLLVGCASTAQDNKGVKKAAPAGEASPLLQKMRVTVDIRYYAGQSLSLATRVAVLSGKDIISTTLDNCGSTPTTNYTRFTTGGIVQPDIPCFIMLIPPREPSQVFPIRKPKKSDELGVWSDWQHPTNQIVSPMPVQVLMNQPEKQQKVTVPLPRQFEVRYMLTPYNARDPKTD
jgi:hypothetical protein